MNLVLDIGNSSAKFGVFQNGLLISNMGSVAHKGIVATIKNQNPQNMIVSAVGIYDSTLPEVPGRSILLSAKTALPDPRTSDTTVILRTIQQKRKHTPTHEIKRLILSPHQI